GRGGMGVVDLGRSPDGEEVALKRLSPAWPSRLQVCRCLVALGRKAEARAEFATIRRLRPENLFELEAWFARAVGDGS
ncbi:MAG: hypothetical protein K2W96_16770, partial [Gemmataceae bacterium]|nr:hypothetical protein [Gemmataceae bacterium]